MSGHDITQAMVGALIVLELFHLRLHNKIAEDLGQLKGKINSIWTMQNAHRPD